MTQKSKYMLKKKKKKKIHPNTIWKEAGMTKEHIA